MKGGENNKQSSEDVLAVHNARKKAKEKIDVNGWHIRLKKETVVGIIRASYSYKQFSTLN